jgi:hypothetical protein
MECSSTESFTPDTFKAVMVTGVCSYYAYDLLPRGSMARRYLDATTRACFVLLSATLFWKLATEHGIEVWLDRFIDIMCLFVYLFIVKDTFGYTVLYIFNPLLNSLVSCAESRPADPDRARQSPRNVLTSSRYSPSQLSLRERFSSVGA